MKKHLLLVLILSLLAITIISCTTSLSNNQPLRTLNVSGTGKVNLEPDIATVNIGVRSQSAEAAEAFEQNNSDAQAIIGTLVNMGIDRSDIQTRNFNIYQAEQQTRPMLEEESRSEGSQTIFVVENTVSVTVRDIDSLGEILTAVVEQGANTIYGVVFDIEDKEAATAEARQMAIQDAREKAQAMAEEAGIQLGPIQTITISQDSDIVFEQTAAMEQPQGGSVPISSGSNTIQVRANLTYTIE